MNIEILKEQHVAILNIAVEISEVLEKGETQNIEIILINFGDEIVAHLGAEDDLLYPVLKKRSDKSVRETAIQFENEMGDIKRGFVEYTKKWDSNDGIMSNYEQFSKETMTILMKITKRIINEENVLFPLLQN